MPVAGAISAVFFAVMFWLLWEDPIAAGPLFKPSKMPVEFVDHPRRRGGRHRLVPGAKAYRKRQRHRHRLAFQQIPIE